jgi:hypothetical protein
VPIIEKNSFLIDIRLFTMMILIEIWLMPYIRK